MRPPTTCRCAALPRDEQGGACVWEQRSAVRGKALTLSRQHRNAGHSRLPKRSPLPQHGWVRITRHAPRRPGLEPPLMVTAATGEQSEPGIFRRESPRDQRQRKEGRGSSRLPHLHSVRFSQHGMSTWHVWVPFWTLSAPRSTRRGPHLQGECHPETDTAVETSKRVGCDSKERREKHTGCPESTDRSGAWGILKGDTGLDRGLKDVEEVARC